MKQAATKTRKARFFSGEIRPEIAAQFGLTSSDIKSEKSLSPNEAGAMLGITGEAVKQWIYQRRLPAVKMGNGYWKIRASDLQKFIQDRQSGPNRPVLVASADPKTVAAFSTALKDTTIDVHDTVNLLDGLLKASNLSPAAIVVDVSSFDDAWQFMAKLKAGKPLATIPILLITGAALSTAEMDKAMSLEVRACIEKPVQPETILRETKLIVGMA